MTRALSAFALIVAAVLGLGMGEGEAQQGRRATLFGGGGPAAFLDLTTNFSIGCGGALSGCLTSNGQNGTYVNSSGFITAATADTLRVTYNPTTLAQLGVLDEESQRNLIPYSNRVYTGPWYNGGSPTVTGSAVASPDGTVDAAQWLRTATGSQYTGIDLTKAASSLPYTWSFYIAQGVGNYCALRMQGNYPGRVDVIFNVLNGTIATAATASGGFSAASATIAAWGQFGGRQWYYVTVTATSDTNTTISPYFSFNSNNVQVDGTDSVSNSSGYVSQADVVQAAYATSTILTNGSAVTRSADNIGYAGMLLSLLNPSSGVFTPRSVIVETTQIAAGNYANYPTIVPGVEINAVGQGYLYDAGTHYLIGAAPGYTGDVRTGYSVGASGRNLALTGSTIVSDSYGVAVGTGFGAIDGIIRRLAVYSSMIPNVALQNDVALTTNLAASEPPNNDSFAAYFGAIPAPTTTLPAPSLIPQSRSFFSLAASPIGAKKVFAHYVMCCGSFGGINGTIGDYEEDIIMAQTMGIQGFVLNVGAWLGSGGSAYQTEVASMFSAAATLNSGFVLFLSADMTTLSYSDVVSFMETYANNANYFQYGGKPVLTTYIGGLLTDSTYTTPSAWWEGRVLGPLASSGINVFFIPAFEDVVSNYPTNPTNPANEVAHWVGLVDGLATFGQTLDTVTPSGVPNDCCTNVANPEITGYAVALEASGKVYMPVSFDKYWSSRGPSNGNAYFEFGGGQGLESQWSTIISANIPWVEIGTWNDYTESYMMPMDDFQKYSDVGSVIGFYKSTVGYAELYRYYIAWFRTGARPIINRDTIFWFYRSHPASATAINSTTPVTGEEIVTGPVSTYFPNPPSGGLPVSPDNMYVTVFAKAPATLYINGVSHDILAGVNQIVAPFVAGAAPTFNLQRNGQLVTNGFGEDAILATPPYYDWWNTSGFVEGPL